MNCLNNDMNWAGTSGRYDAHWMALSEVVELDPLPAGDMEKRRNRRDILVTATALTALLYAILTLSQV